MSSPVAQDEAPCALSPRPIINAERGSRGSLIGVGEKLKMCRTCGCQKPTSQFRRQLSGRLYRNCASCHRPHTQARHPRSYYKSAEYKRECRSQIARKEGRALRPHRAGRPRELVSAEDAETLKAAAWSWCIITVAAARGFIVNGRMPELSDSAPGGSHRVRPGELGRRLKRTARLQRK